METQNVISLSYGKDSLACFEACKILGIPIHRAVHAEVWATDTIPADLPPMVEFKKKADKIIKERYGITVEHISALKPNGGGRKSFESQFYTIRENQDGRQVIYGFPLTIGAWCNSRLKVRAMSERNIREYLLQERKQIPDSRLPDKKLSMVQFDVENSSDEKGFSTSPNTTGDINIVQILGIAADEPERIERHTKPGIRLPLVELGWDEAYCRKWCEENDLLSPIYTTATRGGCWFCHNQGVDQLRLLRKNYPDLWALLLKWDADSPTSFKPKGLTVHDFERRFQLEDKGVLPKKKRFLWKYVKEKIWETILLLKNRRNDK